MSMFDSITQTLADNRKSFVTDEFEELIQISVDKIFKEEYKQEVEQLHKFSLNLFLEGNIFDLLNIFKEKVGTVIKNVPYPRFNIAYFEKVIIFYKPNNSNFSDHEKNFFQKDKYNFYLSIFGDINDVYAVYQALNEFKTEDKSKIDWFYGTSNGVERKSINLDHKYKVYDEFFPWIKNGIDDYYDRFLKSDSTVLFLIGPAGVGKTSFIRELINRNNLKTALTYDEELMKEDALFINFLDNEYNLLVIEDADVVLRDRSEGNKAMNKLLNASDGLVKINKKIIFTANITDVNDIDSALLRPGRCFDVLNFRMLLKEEACAAAVAAGVTEPDGHRTLAELFNAEQQIKQRSNFGFVMS